jgi:hypothetical protein
MKDCKTASCTKKKGAAIGICEYAPSDAPGCEPECDQDVDCDLGDDCYIYTCVDQLCQQELSTDPACAGGSLCSVDDDCLDQDACTDDFCNEGVCESKVSTAPECTCVDDDVCDASEDCSCLDCTDDPSCTGETCTPDATGPGAAPTVSADLDGKSVCRGANVFFSGTNFDEDGMCVGLGETQTLVKATSPNGATFLIAEDAVAGAQTLSVTTADGTASTAGKLTVLEKHVPVTTKLTPTSGPVGTKVTVVGEYLDDTNYVQLSGTAAAVNEPAISNVTATSFDMTISAGGPFPVSPGTLKITLLRSAACGGIQSDLVFTVTAN